MINWDEVKVGETEIVHHSIPGRKLIAGTLNDWVWVYDFAGGYDSYHKNALDDWTIDDPWEDVSEEISWDGNYVIHHHENVLSIRDGRYKTDGRRVWKRKEW